MDTPQVTSATGRIVIPRRRYGRLAAVVVLLLLAAGLARELVVNPAFGWDVVAKYAFHESILQGLLVTLELTVISMTLGILLGILLAVMRISDNRVISGLAGAYIWFFRGTPLLVQLIFWYNFSALYAQIPIGIPFGSVFVNLDTNSVITAFGAAVVGLTLNQGAYMAEIVRGGLLSVPPGQAEAASALGMKGGKAMRLIILPQAMRVIIPPTGNQVIDMLKTTSLVSVIATQDLLYSAQLIYGRTFETIPMLIVASLWYLLVTTILSFIQSRIERKLGESGAAGRAPRRNALSTLIRRPREQR